MILNFGLHLDGMQPAAPITAAGQATLGPARLLELLELHLGLPPTLPLPGAPLLAYQACLAELDGPTRFYSTSFKVDELAVAKTLLDWRAQWHEAGWTGTFAGPVSQRLADMADLERSAGRRTPPTTGQRLQRIATALAQGYPTPIERIVLHSDPSELPAAWRNVLAHLEVTVAPGVNGGAAAQSGTDLRRVQSALLELAAEDSGTRRVRQRLAGDDTVVVVRAISRDLSAQAIAEYLRKARAPRETVLIAEHDGIILDNALERAGLPRAGFQHYSRFRAVAQVLKLALGLLWEPINPHALLQFLIHPVGPLPNYARSKLAEAVAREPGVGGRAWHAAIDVIKERLAQQGRPEPEIAALAEEIRYWLESARFRAAAASKPGSDPRIRPPNPRDAAGAPLDVVIERTQRCATWLARRTHAGENESAAELYAAALAQANGLSAALGNLANNGHATITRIVLERLVDEVSAHAADPATFAQAGHVRATTQPAAITEPWQTVIWWDLAPRTPALTYPWSDAELAQLAREGVQLQPVEQRIRNRVRSWLRPIMNARAQLVLVVHERDEGHHPLWSRLSSLFDNFNEIRIEDSLLGQNARATIPVLDVPTEPLRVKPLPAPRRWWRLPAQCAIPVRATESYSSLRQLLFYPHEWVLSHTARLRRGRAADLPNTNLLAGNLAHRLFETFFNTHPQWPELDERTIRNWLERYLPTLVEQEGALLCEPGAAVTRERVLAILETSFVRLLEHLRGAGIAAAAAEVKCTAPFKDVRLDGTIDLLLRTRTGREVVLDVKFGSEDFRAAELAESRYLQLATYAYLRAVSQEAGSKASAPGSSGAAAAPWPHYAYYIVATGNVLAHNREVFPNAIVHPPATAETIAALWQRVAASYDWRRAQIAAGTIEVNAANTEATAASTPPAHALAAAEEPDRFDDFTWLTGWDQGL